MSGALSFDIYIRRGENVFTKLFPAGEEIDKLRLTYYQTQKGVEALYVHHNDYRQYLFYAEKVGEKFFEKPDSVKTEELVSVLNEIINLSMLEIMVNMQIDQRSVSIAATAVKGCIEALSKDPKSLVQIVKYLTKHPYTIKHSVATAIFSILLVRAKKLESEKTLMTVGLGALLHDIGMSQLSFDAESKAELTPQEWKEVKEHPQLGKRLVDGIKLITSEIKSIIYQHHEQPNGVGYPNGLHDKDIYLLSKVVSICDSFSALVSKRPYRQEAFTPLKALEIMNEERGKFDSELLKLFISIFVHTKN
jgi:HD-GYP domain-containing protein (c-di-GMP phosphodiesterase class II)